MDVSFSQVQDLSRQLEEALRAFPEERRALMERMAASMLATLQSQIGGRGKVMGWQERYLGSGGGYAAVRPRAKTWQETKGGGRYAVGYITNAIDSGHRTRPPGGSDPRYRPRVRKTRVAGKGFYDAAGAQVEALAEVQAEALMARLAQMVERGGGT